MSKHIVKCAICGQSFDRGSIQAVKHGARRYAHYECNPNGELVPLEEKKKKEEDPDLIRLKEYIVKLYGDKANWALITRQIKKFTEENGYSLSGILKSMIYFYEIKKNPINENSHYALGIVPYCYQAAYDYYYSLFIAQNQNQNKDIIAYTTKVKEVIIPMPQIRERKRIINIEVGNE